MENTASLQLEELIRRLNEAERRAKLLKLEVRSIRQEITTIRGTVNTSQNGGVTTQPAVNTRSQTLNRSVILLDSPPGPSTSRVDGPIPSKRQAERGDTNENKKTKVAFTMEDGYVKVYTDGACEQNGRSGAKAGLGVWFGDNHPLNISEPLSGRATNNHAEIRACTRALDTVRENGETKVKIYTDSEFTKNCATNWMNKWKTNSWKTAKGEPVKNKEELMDLDRAMRSMDDVQWVHVRGHRGHRGNEEADKLAREGASRYRP